LAASRIFRLRRRNVIPIPSTWHALVCGIRPRLALELCLNGALVQVRATKPRMGGTNNSLAVCAGNRFSSATCRLDTQFRNVLLSSVCSGALGQSTVCAFDRSGIHLRPRRGFSLWHYVEKPLLHRLRSREWKNKRIRETKADSSDICRDFRSRSLGNSERCGIYGSDNRKFVTVSARWKAHQGRIDAARLVFIDDTWSRQTWRRCVAGAEEASVSKHQCLTAIGTGAGRAQ
jgi:hypothetical protein